ncbi:hypothetical protein D3C81_2089100 [compost metagenome]
MAVIGCCRQQQQAFDTLVVAQQGRQQAVAVTAFTASTQVVRFVHYYHVEARQHLAQRLHPDIFDLPLESPGIASAVHSVQLLDDLFQ